MKKVISFILTMCLLLTSMNVFVYADYICPDPILPDYTGGDYICPDPVLPDGSGGGDYICPDPVLPTNPSNDCTNGYHAPIVQRQLATEYSEKNSRVHYVTNFYETTCRSCGDVVENFSLQNEEAHYYPYNSTVCWYCEYNKECTHKKVNPELTDYYEQYNSKYHKYICEYCETYKECGEIVKEEREVEKEQHYFSGNQCRLCGYEKNCEHQETRIKSYAIDYTYVNETKHYVWYDVEEEICKECGTIVSIEGKNQLQYHYYENGVCTCCGYIRGENEEPEKVAPKEDNPSYIPINTTPEYIEEMLEGRLYGVGNDGNLYKRNYAENMPLGYTDEYEYTPKTSYDNFALPKGELLISEGNYLYDVSGNVVSANVEIMKSCDKRIAELKEVIEQGAQNAYIYSAISQSRKNTIVNSVSERVKEYKSAKRGELTLSNIGENSETYKARTGNKNKTVTDIQQKLYDLGFASQYVTGYYGDVTLNNVAYFQIVNELNVTGWTDKQTYDKLLKSTSYQESISDETIEKPYSDNY